MINLLLSLLLSAHAIDRTNQEQCKQVYDGLSRYRAHIYKYLKDRDVDFFQVDNGFQIVGSSKTPLNIYALKRKVVDRKDVWLVPIITPHQGDIFLARLAFENPALNIILDDMFRNGLTNANYHAMKAIEK